MAGESGSDRLKRLEARIAAAKGEAPREKTEEHYSQAQIAWRMVTELVAGLAIGFGIGLGLDSLFGTGPFLMILFLAFGFWAGVKTMMRTAREVQRAGEDRAAEAARDESARDARKRED